MKGMLAIVAILLLFSSFASAIVIEEIDWKPQHPQPGDDITVYAKISGNVSEVRFQYCVGDACFPGDMEKKGDVWQFVIPGTDVKEGKMEINVTVIDENGSKVYSEREIEVKKGSNLPGFEFTVVIMAIALISLIKVKSEKKMR